MMMKNNTPLAQRQRGNGFLIGARLCVAAMFLALFAAVPAWGQTATYSDSWFVDNSGSAQIDQDEAQINNYSGANQIAGAGVTEPDYDSGSYSVQTTLTAPDGSSASATSYDYEWYSRAEVTLPYNIDPSTVDPNNPVEQQYHVATRHRYWIDDPYQDPCYGCPIQASFKGSSGLYPYYRRYYTFFSFFDFFVSISGQGYTGLSIVSPYNFERPYRCLYSRRTCGGSRCGVIGRFNRILFLAYDGICEEYLQVFFLRVRFGASTSCLQIYGITSSVPGLCY